MKHLKYFESNREPEVGDYILGVDESKYGMKTQITYKFISFLNNNIGQIVKIDRSDDNFDDNYIVRYENEPSIDILDFAFYKKDSKFIKYIPYKIFSNIYSDLSILDRFEILYFSKNKEDVSIKASVDKYNL